MNTPWYHIDNEPNPNGWMRQKAFWLRSAAHYRDPFWRDVGREMNALRQVKVANRMLRSYCIG